MPNLVDLTGTKIGRLTVLGRNLEKPNGPVMWDCVCDCGTRLVRAAKWIRGPGIASCGCYVREHLLNRIKSHGLSRSAEYKIWRGMKNRCEKPNCSAYHKYGARGITVCSRWQKFENFYEDMGKRPTAKHTIDRIDGTKGYAPDNCRWATPKEQQRNLKNNVLLEYNGKSLSVAEWSDVVGIDAKTLWSRVKVLGWTTEEALTLPRHYHHKHKR